jgi:hypothetical protein
VRFGRAEVWPNSRTLLLDVPNAQEVLRKAAQEDGSPEQSWLMSVMNHEAAHVSVYHTTTYGALSMWMELNIVRAMGSAMIHFPWSRAMRFHDFCKPPTLAEGKEAFRRRIIEGSPMPDSPAWKMDAARDHMDRISSQLWSSFSCLKFLRGDLPIEELPEVKKSFLSETGKIHQSFSELPEQMRQISEASTSLLAQTVKNHSEAASGLDTMTAQVRSESDRLAADRAWKSFPSEIPARLNPFYAPGRSAPVLEYLGVPVPLTGHCLFESLGFLAELHGHLAQDLPPRDLLDLYLKDPVYVVAIDYINRRVGLPAIATVDPDTLDFDRFWIQFGFAATILYAALSIPLLPHANTSNEVRRDDFWTLSPMDIQPGWRLLNYVESLMEAGLDSAVRDRTKLPYRDQMNWYRHLTDGLPRASGHATPSSLWFAWGMTPMGDLYDEYRFPGAARAASTTDDQFIHALLDPIPTVLGQHRGTDNVRHWLFPDGYRNRNADSAEWTDLLFDASIRLHFFRTLPESSPLYPEVEKYVDDATAAFHVQIEKLHGSRT